MLITCILCYMYYYNYNVDETMRRGGIGNKCFLLQRRGGADRLETPPPFCGYIIDTRKKGIGNAQHFRWG